MTIPQLELSQLVLDKITTDPNLNAEEMINALLSTGLTLLDLDLGIVSHVRGDDYRIEYIYPPVLGIEQGDVFNFHQTYCDIPLRLMIPIAINPMYNSEHHGHPCYAAFHWESYLGIPLFIHGKVYGTLNFSSVEPREKPFGNSDLGLIEMLGKAITQILESHA